MGVILEHSIAELGYTQRIMNKILLAIAMFGAVQATPEADPAVLYGGYYGGGLGHYGLGHYGYGYPYAGYYASHYGAVQAVFPTPTDGLMVPTMDLDLSMAVRNVKLKLIPLSCMVVTTVMVVWDTMVTDTPTMLAIMPTMVLLSKLVFPMPTDGLMVPTMDLVPSMENRSLSNK